MNVFKKLFASVATFALVASTVPTAVLGQTQFNQEIQDAYNYAYSKGITTITPVGNSNPFGNTTRAQLAKMIVEWAKDLGIYKVRDTLAGKCNGFDDRNAFAQVDKGLADFIVMACEGGLMGLDGNGNPAVSFNPNGTVDRGQFFTVVSRALYGNMYDGGNPFYQNHMTALMNAGLIKQARANDLVARYEAWLVLMRAANLDVAPMCDDPMIQLSCALDLPDCPAACKDQPVITTPEFTTKEGMVSISLDTSTPAARSVPAQGIVPMAVYRLQAGDKDIQVGSITVERRGLGERTDINRIYFEWNGVRVSGRQTIGVDDTATITFSPAIVLKAGSSELITLVASLSGTAGGEHFFRIKSAEMVDSSAATVAGNFPIDSNTQKTTNYNVANVSFNRAGSASTYKVGDTAVEFGAFKIDNQDANKSIILQSITFRNDGTGDPARSLDKIVLKRNGQVISTKAPVINGRFISFPVSDTINGGVSANYQIVADVIGAENNNGDTYAFRLQFAEDLNVAETSTMFKAKVNILSGSLAQYTVDGGDVVLSRPVGQNTDQTISAGTTDALLLRANLNVKQAARLGDVTVRFETGGNFTGVVSTYFTTLKLRVGDRIVATVNPAANQSTFVFEGVTDVTSNTTFEILGNVRSSIPGAATFRIETIQASNFGTKEYVSNGNLINSFIGSIQGISTTVDTTSATVTKSDSLSNSSIVRGASNYTTFGITIKAGATSSLNISQLKFRNIGTNSFVGLTNFELFVGDSATPIASNNLAADLASGSVQFNMSPNLVIPANEEVRLTIKGNFSSALATGSIFQFAFGTSDIVGTDGNGNSITNVLSFVPVNSSQFVITQEGTLSASPNNNPNITAQSAMLLGANAVQNIFAVTLAAQFDDIRVTDMFFVTTGPSAVNITDNLGQIQLVDGSQTYNCSKVSAEGIRCDLGASSNVIVPKDGTKEVALRVTVANGTSSGTYLGRTGLQLILSTGTTAQIPLTALNKQGIYANGVRGISMSAGSTVTVAVQSPIESRAHVIARTRAIFASAPGTIDATNAHRFSITPQGSQRVVLKNVHIQISQASVLPATNTMSLHRGNQANNPISSTIVSTVTCGAPLAANVCNFEIIPGVEISTTENFVLQITAPAGANETRSVNVVNAVIADWFSDGNIDISPLATFGNSGIPTDPSSFRF